MFNDHFSNSNLFVLRAASRRPHLQEDLVPLHCRPVLRKPLENSHSVPDKTNSSMQNSLLLEIFGRSRAPSLVVVVCVLLVFPIDKRQRFSVW